MSDTPRRDPAPERDHVSPADLLSDDPDTTVDMTAIRARTQSPIGPGTCAALRRSLRGTRSVEAVADELGVEYNERTFRRHYNGRCAHDVAASPVVWDASAREWRVRDDVEG